MIDTLIISLVIGLIVAVIFVATLVYRYKRGVTSPIYPLEHYTNLNLKHSQDTFVNRSVTCVKVASSSSNKK